MNSNIHYSRTGDSLDDGTPLGRFLARQVDIGCDFVMEGELDKAALLFNKLLSRSMDHPAFIYYVGSVETQRGNHGLAANLFKRATQIKPEFHAAWHSLAFTLHMEQFNDRAEEAIKKAIDINPEEATYWNTLCTMYINEGRPQKCIEAANKCLELDPGHKDAHHNRGIAHLELGNWKEGWDGYKWRFLSDLQFSQGNHWSRSSVPRWEGQKGKRIMVHGEQGLGDEVLFSTCLPDIIADSSAVALDLNPKLDKLYRRSFPDLFMDLNRAETTGKGNTDWADGWNPDYKVSVGELPRFYRNKDTDFPKNRGPLLKPDPKKVAYYKSLLDGRFNVAFAWMGGMKKTRLDLRMINPEDFKPLFALPNTRFISMQYHSWAANEADAQGFEHWETPSKDQDEMAAMMTACDLVISVCQTAVHIAGALGVPCWVLTPSKPAWRYGLKGESMIWYPSVRVVRQEKEEKWADTIIRTAADLSKLIQEAA